MILRKNNVNDEDIIILNPRDSKFEDDLKLAFSLWI